MNRDLVQKLIERGAIKARTEIEAHYRGVDLSGAPMARVRGNFIILAARAIGDQIIFDGFSTEDGRKQRILSEDIINIDGMDIERFASIYGLSLSGEVLRQGKRRGRKPKALLEKLAAEAAANQNQDQPMEKAA